MFRKICFILADHITKINNESHSYRYEIYYVLQVILSQILQLIILLLISLYLCIIKEFIFIVTIFWISKLFIKVWHATSFLACNIIGIILLIGSSLAVNNGNFFIGATIIIAFGVLSSNSHVDNILTKFSKNIDIIYFYTKKRCRYTKKTFIKLINSKIFYKIFKG